MIFYPDRYLKKTLPKGFFDKELLNNKNLSLKKNAMQALILATDIKQKDFSATILKVSKFYENKIDNLEEEGIPKVKASILAKNGEKLLRQRIESLVVFSAVEKIKTENEGDEYEWLPSSSLEPDPEHQLLYGQKFKVGEGDSQGNMPGQRYGCNCGMRILKSSEKDS